MNSLVLNKNRLCVKCGDVMLRNRRGTRRQKVDTKLFPDISLSLVVYKLVISVLINFYRTTSVHQALLWTHHKKVTSPKTQFTSFYCLRLFVVVYKLVVFAMMGFTCVRSFIILGISST